jgi:hypothetical protein
MVRPMARSPKVGGPKPVALNSVAPAELEAAFVVSVKVVVTLLAPGVTLAGEKEAVHLLGSPVQLKVTGESNGPYWGVSWIVKVADWPAVTVRLVGDALSVKLDTWTARALVTPPDGAGLETVT